MRLKQELDREFVGIARPDLWAEIERRAAQPGPTELPASDGGPGGLPRDRVVAAVVALLVILGAVAILWSAFRSAPPGPADTPSPAGIGPGPRRNGEIIQFENVAGSSSVDLAVQDPGTGQLRLFADTSSVLDCSYARGEDCNVSVGRAAWSADGRWVAFETMRGWAYGPQHPRRANSIPPDPKAGLWVVGAEGEPRQVTGLCRSCNPKTTDLVWAWGPAGRGVAYASGRPGEGELFVFDPSDGTRRPLGRVDGRITALSWSPDGRRIAVAASGVLYLVDVASGQHAGIATYQGVTEDTWSAGWPAGVKWSPDGTKFAVVTLTHTSGRWTWSVHILSTDGKQLADLPVPGGGSFLEDPEVAWSPDGTRIAYVVYYRQNPGPQRLGAQVWTVGSFGQVAQKILDPGCCIAGSLHPAWSPDGSSLGFTYWAAGGSRRGLVVDIYYNGTGGEAHAIDERVVRSWRGGSFSSEGWAPGKLG